MPGHTIPTPRASGLLAFGAGLMLVALGGCQDDGVGPSPETTTDPTIEDVIDSAAEPVADPGAPAAALLDNRSRQPGIVFGTVNIETADLNSVHNGWLQGGKLSPTSIVSKLSALRAKGGRAVVKLSMGSDSYVKTDGRFSLTKWKALVDRYKNVNLGPFIQDGTIIGHYLVDEPHRGARWGGNGISHATLEEMAAHSKRIWPDMTTFVRVVPSWLAGSSVTYRHLDAGWLQYTAGKGEAGRLVAAEAAAAKRKGLGLIVGMSVTTGGARKGPMTATEIKNFGTALLNEPHACGFFNFTYNRTYYNRSDIKSAFATVSAKARSHAKTSCRQ